MSGDKTIDEIQDKIGKKRAKVYTASEFKEMVRSGSRPDPDDVDIVTCGTFGVMSGTMAVFTIPVAPAGTFKRADAITLNGVPGIVGPCPNESLGLVDCIVYGPSRRDMSYGGGHLFRDIVEGKPIDVAAVSGGVTYRNRVTLSSMPFARMILTRGSFKNYTCFVNGSSEPFCTIFSGPEPLKGGLSEASVSGCGEINPLQNDPHMDYLRPGSAVLLNGAPGMVIGTGTRSTPDKPNLSVEADMHMMRPEYMGGFRTSEGPECLTSVAAAIPMTGAHALELASVLDEDVKLPLAEVSDRKPVHETDYGSVWRGGDLAVSADMTRCLHCEVCRADALCPTDAAPSSGADPSRCMSCGICVNSCPGKVFSAELGSVPYGGRTVPISVRQSSRSIAEKICADLKSKVENGNWNLRCFDGKI